MFFFSFFFYSFVIYVLVGKIPYELKPHSTERELFTRVEICMEIGNPEHAARLMKKKHKKRDIEIGGPQNLKFYFVFFPLPRFTNRGYNIR